MARTQIYNMSESIDDAAIDRFTDHDDTCYQKENIHISPVMQRRKRVRKTPTTTKRKANTSTANAALFFSKLKRTMH